jgi:SulP family sulfate permease
MLFFGKWATLIPMATLAGILVIVAYNMSELHLFISIFNNPRSDVMVLLSTFTLTVLVDLVVAIQVGVVLASFLFMKRMAEVTQFGYVKRQFNEDDRLDEPFSELLDIPEGVDIFEVNGPFFFAAAEKFKSTLNIIETKPKVLILRMRNVLSIDATGLKALKEVVLQCQKDGIHLLLSGVHSQPLFAMEKSGLTKMIGTENLCENIEVALKKAKAITSQSKEN